MAEAYRGLHIRFAADAKGVMQAIRGMRNAAADVNSELKQVQKALRFDPGNLKATATQMNLLREKASTSDAMVRKLRKHYAELGNIKINGVAMRELSARTRDAATQASLARERYNSLVEELAVVRKQIKSLNKAEATPANVAALAKAKEKARALAIQYKEASDHLKQLNKVAQYQSFGNKITAEAAKAKEAVRAMTAAWEAAPVTRYTEQVKRAQASTRTLAASAKQMKEAMELDPSSFAAAIAAQDRMREHTRALIAENEKLHAEMQELGKTKGVVELAHDFDKLQAEERAARTGVDQLGAELTKARGKVTLLTESMERLQAEIIKNPPEVEKLWVKLQKAETAQRELTAAAERANAEYMEMGSRLQTVTQANAYRALNDATIANTAAIAANEKATSKAQRTRTVAFHAMKSLGMSAYMTITPAAMMLGQYAVQSANEIDSAYRNMRKTVDGTEEQFQALQQSALKFGDTHFTSADQILQIQALGGQLGIAAEDLDKFAETAVSNIAVATDMDIETIALKMGQLSNILKDPALHDGMNLTKESWEGFSDALVRLGNNSPTLESNIMNVMSRISPMGAIVKMGTDQLLGWSTAVASTGQNSEAAGTAIARTMSQIEQSVAAGSGGMDAFTEAAGMSYQAWMELYNSDSAAAADVISSAVNGSAEALETLAAACEMTGDELVESLETDGVAAADSFAESIADSSERLNGFAEVAGMTADEFSKLWEEDASAAMQAFVGGLKRIDEEGGSVDGTLANLKINAVRQKQALEGLTNTYDVLCDSLQMSKDAMNGVGDQWGAAGDAAREAARKAEGFSGALQMVKNTGQHLAMIIGDELAPMLRNIAIFLADVADGAQNASPGLKKFVLGLTAMLIASGPVLTMYTSIGTAIDNFRQHSERARNANRRLASMNSGVAGSLKSLNGAYSRAAANLAGLQKEQQRYIQSGKAIPTHLTNQIRQAEKAEKRFYKLGSAVNKVASAFKAVGGALAIAAVFKAISLYAEYQDKMKALEKSTTGLVSASKNFSASLKDVGRAEQETESDSQSLVERWLRIGNVADEMAEKGAALADSIKHAGTSVSGSSAELDHYANTIRELAGHCNGSSEKLQLLKDAVEQYNQIAGTSLQVTDNYSGALDINSAAFDANTEAIKRNLKVNALKELLTEAYKHEAELQQAVTDQEGKYKEAKEATTKALQEQGVEFGRESDGALKYSSSVLNAQAAEEDERKKLEELTEQRIAASQAIGSLTSDFESASAEAAKYNKQLEQNAETTDSFRASVDGTGMSFDQMVENIRAAAEAGGQDVESLGLTADELAEKLKQAGIHTDQFAQLGTEAFARLYQEAGFDINGVMTILNLANAFNLDPKTLHVTEDGIEDTQGRLWAFNKDAEAWFVNGVQVTVHDDGTITAKEQDLADLSAAVENVPDGNFSVTDHGTINAKTGEMQGLSKAQQAANAHNVRFRTEDGGTTKKSTQDVQTLDSSIKKVPTSWKTVLKATNSGALRAIEDVRVGIRGLKGKTIDLYVNTHKTTYVKTRKEAESASGGFSPGWIKRIPMHAAGGMTGIVKSATLTNYGWVGEDGAEAIIPLDNPRYVRPFANAVAQEMSAVGGGETVNVTNVYVNNARVNDDPQILAVTKDYLTTLQRKGLMR